ncbi:MAG TPA: hypothetical protein PK078_07330 [Anaerolineales bacterium]|nr:hypothetical protein [Anaerolineales bacterium]
MPISTDLIGGILGFLFTILILSYLIGDNPFFRVAVYIFVGVASGYVASVILWQVLIPRLWLPTLSAIQTLSIPRLVYLLLLWLFVLLVFMKVFPGLSGMSRLAMAVLVGAGAAVTLIGAVNGTLIPQVEAAINYFDPKFAAANNISPLEIMANGAILMLGTVTSLAYFHFGARPKADGSMRRFVLVEIIALLGQIFIGITLGVIFAGVYAAALTALIERVTSMVTFFNDLLIMFGIL